MDSEVLLSSIRLPLTLTLSPEGEGTVGCHLPRRAWRPVSVVNLIAWLFDTEP